MRDINVIGGDGLLSKLAFSEDLTDRFLASKHFVARANKSGPSGRLRIWYSRSAIMELKAACETIKSSLPSRASMKAWDQSEQAKIVRSDPLLKCLAKVRDFCLHTSEPALLKKKFEVHVYSERGVRLQRSIEVFVVPLSAGGHNAKSGISADEIEWFNRQAEQWPLEHLLRHAWWIFACQLANFAAISKLRTS